VCECVCVRTHSTECVVACIKYALPPTLDVNVAAKAAVAAGILSPGILGTAWTSILAMHSHSAEVYVEDCQVAGAKPAMETRNSFAPHLCRCIC
jgi:hypothetical protein